MDTLTVSAAKGAEVCPNVEEFLSGLARLRDACDQPFSPQRLELAASVGTRILRAKGIMSSPAVVHFAFWTRAAALKRLADEFVRRVPSDCLARPVGLVFHLPPQNVETVFLYSWMLSYLTGNANVVRLPSGLGDEMRALLDLFLEAFQDCGERTQLFVRYPSDSDLSRAVSAHSDARIVWGGDAKVAAFAGIPLRKGGKSLWFGDRFSLCAIDGAALGSLDADGLRTVAADFVNDVYVFDQMACSSPHVIYVVGDERRHGADVRRFLAEVSAAARAKGFEPPTGHAIHKVVEAFAAAGRGEARSLHWQENVLTAVEMKDPRLQERRVGGGYVEYRYVEDLSAIIPHVREHHQTLTYFGFQRADLIRFASNQTQGGFTRIVPIGQALDFDFVWDGYDLPFELARMVRVR